MAAITQLSPGGFPGGRYAFTAKTSSAVDATPEPAQADTTRIKLRRSTVAAATKLNEVLYHGEVMFDKQTSEYVVGDGSRTFAQLRRPMRKPPAPEQVRGAIQIMNYTNFRGGL